MKWRRTDRGQYIYLPWLPWPEAPQSSTCLAPICNSKLSCLPWAREQCTCTQHFVCDQPPRGLTASSEDFRLIWQAASQADLSYSEFGPNLQVGWISILDIRLTFHEQQLAFYFFIFFSFRRNNSNQIRSPTHCIGCLCLSGHVCLPTPWVVDMYSSVARARAHPDKIAVLGFLQADQYDVFFSNITHKTLGTRRFENPISCLSCLKVQFAIFHFSTSRLWLLIFSLLFNIIDDDWW